MPPAPGERPFRRGWPPSLGAKGCQGERKGGKNGGTRPHTHTLPPPLPASGVTWMVLATPACFGFRTTNPTAPRPCSSATVTFVGRAVPGGAPERPQRGPSMVGTINHCDQTCSTPLAKVGRMPTMEFPSSYLCVRSHLWCFGCSGGTPPPPHSLATPMPTLGTPGTGTPAACASSTPTSRTARPSAGAGSASPRGRGLPSTHSVRSAGPRGPCSGRRAAYKRP